MVFTLIIMVIILLVLIPVGIVVDKKIEAYLKIKENLKFKFIGKSQRTKNRNLTLEKMRIYGGK